MYATVSDCADCNAEAVVGIVGAKKSPAYNTASPSARGTEA